MCRLLYIAASSQNLGLLAVLARSVDVSETTPVGDNLLHIALRRLLQPPPHPTPETWPESLLRLLTQPNRKGETPLHVALKAGNYEIFVQCVRALMLNPERWRNPSTASSPEAGFGWKKVATKVVPQKSLLYLAAEAGHSPAVRVLLESPWPWAQYSFGPKGSTALHAAIQNGHSDLCLLLVDQRPNLIKSMDINGDTPLHLAVCMEDPRLVEQLVRTDADVAFSLNKDGLSPVHVAAALGFLHSFERIHDLCPEACRAATDKGRNSLHVAVRNGRFEIVQYILRNFDEAVINEQDIYGNTPLHVAHRWRAKWMIKILSRHPLVDRTVRNYEGLDCFQFIQQVDRKEKLSMNTTFGIYLGDVRSLPGTVRLQGLHMDIAFFESQILSKIPERVKALASSSSVVATLIVGVAFSAAFSVTSLYNSCGVGCHTGPARLLLKVFIIADALSAILAIFAAFNLIFAGGLTDRYFLRIKVRRSMLAVQAALSLLLVAFGSGAFVAFDAWNRWLAVLLLSVSCSAPIGIPAWSYLQEDRYLLDSFGGPLRRMLPSFILVPVYRIILIIGSAFRSFILVPVYRIILIIGSAFRAVRNCFAACRFRGTNNFVIIEAELVHREETDDQNAEGQEPRAGDDHGV